MHLSSKFSAGLLHSSFSLIFFGLSVNVVGQNLVVNGSMTSLKGADVAAPGWEKSYISPLNTPDINDTSGQLQSTPGA
jgi:hypothetical protein